MAIKTVRFGFVTEPETALKLLAILRSSKNDEPRANMTMVFEAMVEACYLALPDADRTTDGISLGKETENK